MTRKMLMVDDEPHILLLLERTLEELEDHDIELIRATDGQQALDLIRSERPAVVFLDVMMPVLGGFDVCRTIKGDPELRDTYVVVLTAKGQVLDREQAEEVGADQFLTKPFSPDTVLSLAAEALGIELED